jgi:hypothetical protein
MSGTEPKTFGLVSAGSAFTLYHRDEVNHCPHCAGTQWNIGRIVAECVRCKAAIPLVSPNFTTSIHRKEAA